VSGSLSRPVLPVLKRGSAERLYLLSRLLVVATILLGLVGMASAGAGAASAATVPGTTWYVTSTGSATGCLSPAGTPSDPFGTVAGALACAANGDVISVGAGSFVGGFTISSNVTIEGAGALQTTIEGLAPTTSQAATSEVALAPGVEATLDGLTVAGGTYGSSSQPDITNAVSLTSGSLILDRVFVKDAVTTSAGAVVSASPPSGTAVSVTVEASTIATGAAAESFSTDAGLVVHYNGSSSSVGTDMSVVSIVNSTVDVAANETGAVTLLNTNATLLDDTINANELQALRAIDSSIVTIGGTILASSGANAAECEVSSFTDLGNNLSSGSSSNDGCDFTNSVHGDIVSTTNLSPGFGALADNGGPTPTLALLAGSPAIGTNSVSNCTSSVLVNDLDQRGDPRNAPTRVSCDIGAYDTGGTPHTTWYVTSTGSATGCLSPAGTPSDPFGTVAGALACAANGDVISVGAGSFVGGFTISSNVTIEGAGALQTTIEGLAPTTSQAATSEVALAPGVEATLDGLTVAGGTYGSSSQPDITNAVSLTSGSLILDRVFVKDAVTTSAGAVVSASPPSGTAVSVTVEASTIATGAAAESFSTDAGLVVHYNGSSSSVGTDMSVVSIVNSTVDVAANETGAVTLLNTNATLLDDTINANELQALRAIDSSIVTIGGTILASSGANAAECEVSSFTDLGNNLSSGSSSNDGCDFTNSVHGDIVSTTNLSPGFGALADNGGPTPTLALLAGSPAIGTNSVSNCTSSVLVNDLDQRGDPRNAPTRVSCDIGAYDTGGNGAPLTWAGGPGSGPSARSYPAMATATSGTFEGLTLMFGGVGPGYGYLGDTWEFSTASFGWQNVGNATAVAPSARAGASLVWDAASDEFILFGGISARGFQGDTWAFNPANGQWSQLSPSASPNPRAMAAVSSLSNGEVILFGGVSYSGFLGDTWVYSLSSNEWTEVASSGPTARWGAAMAANPTTGATVLFGGAGRSGFDGDTWSFDPNSDTWSEISTAGTAPLARAGAGLIYDTAAATFVLVDGDTSSGYSNGTYAFSASTSTWFELSPVTSPTPRTGAGVTYDPSTNTLVQFGGYSSGGDRSDTWELEGQI